MLSLNGTMWSKLTYTKGSFRNTCTQLPSAHPWCAILTPFGGLRFFKRGIQGLINQSEELDEMLANIFGNMITQGKLVKLADDLFTGGVTKEQTILNFKELLSLCKANNISCPHPKQLSCQNLLIS